MPGENNQSIFIEMNPITLSPVSSQFVFCGCFYILAGLALSRGHYFGFECQEKWPRGKAIEGYLFISFAIQIIELKTTILQSYCLKFKC